MEEVIKFNLNHFFVYIINFHCEHFQLKDNTKKLIQQLEKVIAEEEEAIAALKEELRQKFIPYNHHRRQIRALKAEFSLAPTRNNKYHPYKKYQNYKK